MIVLYEIRETEFLSSREQRSLFPTVSGVFVED